MEILKTNNDINLILGNTQDFKVDAGWDQNPLSDRQISF